MREPTQLTADLLEQIDRCGLNDCRLSKQATGKADAVRNLRRGIRPQADTVEALCRALGLEIRLVKTAERKSRSAENATPPTRFSKTTRLRVQTWDSHDGNGMLRNRRKTGTAPAPENWDDLHAFYAIAPDDQLANTGIRHGDVCLISPHAALTDDTLAWFRKSDGAETIGWLAKRRTEGYEIARWTSNPAPTVQLLKVTEVYERGPIVAIYETTPRDNRLLQPKPAWTPDAAGRLWLKAIIDDKPELKAFLDTMQDAVLQVTATAALLTILKTQGVITGAEADEVPEALEILTRGIPDRVRKALLEASRTATKTPAGAATPTPAPRTLARQRRKREPAAP